MYWHVDYVAATFEKLLWMGAREYQPIAPRGDEGFVTAAVVDPLGNVLGMMYNPHYPETLKSSGRAGRIETSPSAMLPDGKRGWRSTRTSRQAKPGS
jgi:hypothetical protein